MFIYSDNLMNCLLKIITEKSFHYFNILPYTYPYELCSMLGARMYKRNSFRECTQ